MNAARTRVFIAFWLIVALGIYIVLTHGRPV